MNVSATTAGGPRVWMRRILRWFILPFFGILALAIAGLFLICAFKGEFIASTLEQQLRAGTGLPWRIQGPVTPGLFPYPGISVENVRVLAASTAQEQAASDVPPLMSVNRLHVLVDFPALLRGRLRLHLVELESPSITLAYDRNGNPLWIPLPQASDSPEQAPTAGKERGVGNGTSVGNSPGNGTVPGDSSGNGTVPAHEIKAVNAVNASSPVAGNGTALVAEALPVRLDAEHGKEDVPASLVSPQEQTRQALASLNSFLAEGRYEDLPELRVIDGTFTLLEKSGEVNLSFHNLQTTLAPTHPDEILRYAAIFSLPPAGLEVHVSGVMGLALDPVALTGSLQGTVSITPPGSRAAAGAFSSSVSWAGGSESIRLPDFRFEAEGDSLSADLTADVVAQAYSGSVEVHTLSLPRWFKFGRNLPPGLQQPLHTLMGTLDVYGTDHMVEGRNMRFMLGGLEVVGNISCPDYAAPEILVNLDIDSANLDLVFPFLTAPGTVVPEPVEPVFTMSPLLPFPGLPEDASPDVGYDVRIHVAKPLVHQLAPGPLDVRVFPLNDGRTRVAFTDNELLDGKIEGRLDIKRGQVKMHYDVANVGLADLPENKGNSVVVGGAVTGTADLDIAVDKNGHWADDWDMVMDARVSPLKITGGKGASAWWVTFGTAEAKGKGPLHAVRRDGIRISGAWDVALGNIHTSWFPKGQDAINGRFTGALAWPPKKPEDEHKEHRRGGVERVFGDLEATGTLIVPLGSERVPVTGKMRSKADWNLYKDTIALDDVAFDGLGGFVGGKVFIDASGNDVAVTAPVNFKLAPRVLLKAWDLLPSGGVQMPATLTGTASVSGLGNKVVFDQIKAQADGDPIEGTITGSGGQSLPQPANGKAPTGAGKGSHWVFRLTSSRLNLDTFLPPSTPEEKKKAPSKEPWKLSFLSNLSLDAELVAQAAKFHGANLVNTKITAALQRGRFSLQAETADFYGGVSTLLAQGTFVPERSQMNISRLLGEMKGFSLGRALYDLTQDDAYGGKSDIIFDLSGVMQSNADLYAGLSGIWSMKISDGLYPAFLGSETAGLRNTFSEASASGVMEKGVLKADNFLLRGVMVDMYGGGWVDLVQDTLNLEIYVTLAKVPTVPVRFYGDIASPSMTLRGAHMVVHTAQAAGSTVFSLVMGVLELPGRAVRAISGEDTDKKQEVPAKK